MDVVRQVGYDSAFTFIYSPRTGTPAAKWAREDQTPASVIKDRFDRLLAQTQKDARNRAAAYTGSIQEVLVEEVNRQDPALVTGRMSNNSTVHFPGGADLIGRLVQVRLTECRGFYYIGEQIRV